ncbi:MAG: glycosyltransferase [Polyangiales bacterium]
MTRAATLWGAVVTAASLVAVARSRLARGEAADGDALTLTIARPCAGYEEDLSDRLATVGEGLDRARSRVRLGVATEGDGALAAVRSATERLRDEGVDAACLVTHAVTANQKCGQVAALLEGAGTELVAVVDSDVDLAGFDWRSLAAPMRDPRVGAVWAPPVEVNGRTPWDRASAAVLGASLHAFPLLSQIDPAGMVGKVLLLRREALDVVGGFDALGDVLGEDMALARRLRDAGWKVLASSQVARAVPRGRDRERVVSRYARWVTVIRAQRPALLASYPLLFFATGPLVAVTARRSPAVALSVLAARVLVAREAQRRAGVSRGWSDAVADAAMADGVLAAAFLRAVTRRTVEWRGRALRVDAGGVAVSER